MWRKHNWVYAEPPTPHTTTTTTISSPPWSLPQGEIESAVVVNGARVSRRAQKALAERVLKQQVESERGEAKKQREKEAKKRLPLKTTTHSRQHSPSLRSSSPDPVSAVRGLASISLRPGDALNSFLGGGPDIEEDLRLLQALPPLATPSLESSHSFTPNSVQLADSDDSSVLSSPNTSDDESHRRRRRKRPVKRVKKLEVCQTLKDRKSYLTAGLYSSNVRTDESSSSLRTGKPVFPLPINHGTTLFETRESSQFRLPFDIYSDYVAEVGHDVEVERERLERIGRGRNPEVYEKIGTNQCKERKMIKSSIKPAICSCTTGSCDESCFNRMMQYLCSPQTCPRGSECKNGPLNLRQKEFEEGNLKVFYTGNRGWGLKTLVDIQQGQFVVEYRGEIISRDESYRRVLNEYKGKKSFYFLDYNGHEVLDAGRRGNCSRFINHSCDPNLTVMRLKLNGWEEYQIALFASKPISAGSELCYDYAWQNFKDLVVPQISKIRSTIKRCHSTIDDSEEGEEVAPADQKCFCGAESCKGFLGAKRKTSEVGRRGRKRRKESKLKLCL